ncbi:MAG TPA: ABC transporter substrate-binding protein [Desulfomonilaceae bacterium]|nr:ABC transporter substrate-binding protein [Desulfomonilaceae bacterium]
MNKSSVLRSLFLALILCAAMGLYAWGADPIKIGVIGPMQFTQGEGHWNGATLAAEEINKAGGISVKGTKRPIELVKVDSNEFLSIPDATNAVELAISRHHVDFLVGGFRTEAVMVMQDIAMDNKKIFMGCGAAHPELCERVTKDYDRYKYWFRVTPVNSKFLVKVDFLLLQMAAEAMSRELNIPKIKVAIVAEKAAWADPIVGIAQQNLPKMGLEIVGVWRPSPTATDTTSELSAIQRAGAHIIFTTFSSSVGIPFAKQAGELKIPAPLVGINVEAQKDGFWEATGGKGNYSVTVGTYARVKINDTTIPFFNEYLERFKESPNYTAGTHDAIVILKHAIETAGTLDSDKLVPVLEKTDLRLPQGRFVFTKDHDVTWGPGFVTEVGTEWQDGKNMCVWPYNWEGVTYEGAVPYKLPDYVIEHYKKK